MNAEDKICYSPVPALNTFVAPPDDCGSESPMQLLLTGLLKAQMNLSRLVMYSRDDSHNAPQIREAMSIIADVYGEFENIEASRKKYIEAMQGIE